MKKVKKHFIKQFSEDVNTPLLAYSPAIARMTDSPDAGILLSQLLYWHKKGSQKEWFYKTIEELEWETGLSRSRQDTAIKKLRSLKLIETKLRGCPPKRNFKIHYDYLVKTIKANETKLRESCKLKGGVGAKYYAECKQYITKNTSKNTFKDFSLQESRSKRSAYQSRGDSSRFNKVKNAI